MTTMNHSEKHPHFSNVGGCYKGINKSKKEYCQYKNNQNLILHTRLLQNNQKKSIILKRGYKMKNRIKILRKERNLTQSELAEILGVNQSIVQKLETGSTNLDLPWMRRLASALAVSPLELLPEDIISPEEIAVLEVIRKKTTVKDIEIQKEDKKDLYKPKSSER